MGLDWSDEEGFVCYRIWSYFIYSRLIESSLGSVATKFNFFIHNLAQLRFSGLPSNDEPILSFSAKTYSLKQDGRIKQVSVFTYQKRYNPDKHYVSMWNLFLHSMQPYSFPFFFSVAVCCLGLVSPKLNFPQVVLKSELMYICFQVVFAANDLIWQTPIR